MNGGLWCSPVANTSSPTSSAFFAISTVALIRSCSVGVRPLVGSGVTSPTVKIPNCMSYLLPRAWSLRIQLHVQRRRDPDHSRGGLCRPIPSPGYVGAGKTAWTGREREGVGGTPSKSRGADGRTGSSAPRCSLHVGLHHAGLRG